MNKQYIAEFKLEAVSKVAAELGVKPTTMQGWIKKYKQSPQVPFPGSGHLNPEDEKLRRLERENRELKGENEILKKAAAYFAKNLK